MDRDPGGLYGAVEARVAELESAREAGDTAKLWQLVQVHEPYLRHRHRWPELAARYDRAVDCF